MVNEPSVFELLRFDCILFAQFAQACLSIATDKRGYPHNIFLISLQKHMLLVLIRTHIICFHGEIRKISAFFG